MREASTRLALKKSYARSRIGNGSALLPSVDGRSVWARILRDTLGALASHCGGADLMSETTRLLARRVATLEAELIFLEDRFASVRTKGGEPQASDLDLYGRLADRQRRLAEPLGWERRAKNVTPPTLAEYLASKEAAS
jgi:hypothetical protein